MTAHRRATSPAATDQFDVAIPIDPAQSLRGQITIPNSARGLVVFVHGSGSSRFSPRNRFVADQLNGEDLGTLLFDLLTEQEAAERQNVFDIALLTERISAVRDWLAKHEKTSAMPIGLFGASTGSAAALASAAIDPNGVFAVVSRGGRPDLAAPWLSQVQAPTLFIVGGLDHPVLEWNQQAAELLHCEHEVVVVPGATHLFEEPGALDEVAMIAGHWFARWVRSLRAPR